MRHHFALETFVLAQSRTARAGGRPLLEGKNATPTAPIPIMPSRFQVIRVIPEPAEKSNACFSPEGGVLLVERVPGGAGGGETLRIRRTHAAARYAIALVLSAALMVGAVLLQSVAHDVFLSVPLGAVAIVTLLLGAGPGLFLGATLGLGIWYFALEPRGSLAVTHLKDVDRLLAYFVTCVIVSWTIERMRGTQRRLAEARVDSEHALAVLRTSEERYRQLFESMDEGFALHELVYDESGVPVDYRFLELNPAFARMTGLDPAQLVGRTVREAIPGIEPSWIETYARVVASRRPERFQAPADALGRWFECFAFPAGPRRFGVAFSDVTARKQAQAEREQLLGELSERAAELETADRRKDEFLGMLSHELRNPLAPIRNSVEILERVPPGSPPARRAQQVIERQVDHMSRLIEDLLDVTRISQGKIRLRKETLDLGAVLRTTVDDLRSVVTQSGILLELMLPEEPVVVDADRTRVAQVVGNLLQNAAKFTPPGGHAWLSLETDGAQAVIRVRDDGAGLDDAVKTRLFEPFVQGEATLDRSHGGLGLGLALVRGVVLLHGGEVSARSPGRHQGTEFVVRLPLARACRPASPEAPRAVPGTRAS